MSDSTKITTTVKLEELANVLAYENYKLFLSKSKSKDLVMQLLLTFTKHFIKYTLLHSLENSTEESMTKPEKYIATRDSFAKTKGELQTFISDAFSDTFKDWAGQDVDYYCIIKPIGEPINKKPC